MKTMQEKFNEIQKKKAEQREKDPYRIVSRGKQFIRLELNPGLYWKSKLGDRVEVGGGLFEVVGIKKKTALLKAVVEIDK